jgi:CspA family cold shock protein
LYKIKSFIYLHIIFRSKCSTVDWTYFIGGSKMEGIVKWFNRTKSYGFIQGDDGQEYFVHRSALTSGTFLRENDKVSFDPAEGEKGKQAQNVTLLQKGSEREGEAPAEEAPEEEAAPEEAPEEEAPEEEAAPEEAPEEEAPEEEKKEE